MTAFRYISFEKLPTAKTATGREFSEETKSERQKRRLKKWIMKNDGHFQKCTRTCQR